jgi:hypothetical protein
MKTWFRIHKQTFCSEIGKVAEQIEILICKMPDKYSRLKPSSTYVRNKFLPHLHLVSKELFLVGAKY